MKPNLLVLLCILSVVTFSSAQVGIGTPLPNASAQLDIVASDKGVLIPRLNIADLDTAAPVEATAIQTSLLAYNTNTTSGVGYYYWNGLRWVRLATSEDAVTESITSLTENGDGTYTYTHQDGTITIIDFSSAETSTDLVDNGDGTLTYTNEENVEQTIDILATVTTDIQNQGDIYDEIINVVNANSDELLDNGDGTFAHTAADGTTVNFDVTQKATGNPNTNGTIGAAGNVYVDESTGDMYTHNGTAWEPVGVTAADLTDDAWINNPTDGVIELGTKSDGTARDPLTEVLISDTGRIAIGRSTPGVAFEIVSETPGANGMTVRSFNNTTNPGAFLTHWTARGTSTSPLAVVDGDNIGRYVGTSYDGTTFRNAASIQLEVDGTPSAATGVPGAVVFNTTNSTAQPAERMRVASDGNVGIGTNTPNERLEVNGKVRISDLTGTDTATDVIVTADAVSGVLKDGGTLAEVAAATEPWFGAGPDAALGTTDDIGATLNTEDIYSLGNVTIGDNSPNNGIPLRVRDPGTVPDPYGSGIARPPAAMEFNFSGATLSQNQYTITGAPQGYGILKQHNLDAAFTTRIYTGEDNVIRNTTSNTTNILGNRLLLKDLAGGNLSTYVGNVTRVDKHGGAVAYLTGEIISARLFAGATATNRITGLSVSTDIRAGATAPVATGISVDDVIGATENYAIRTGLGNVSFGDTVFATSLDDSNPLATDVLVTANAATGELKDGGTIAEIAALADLRLVGDANHITSDAGVGSDGTSVGTGARNVAIGPDALSSSTTGFDNIAIGFNSLSSVTEASNNIALGWSALSSYASGTLNIAIGNSSLRYHVTGDQNIAMGFASLQNHVNGTDNISIGTKSLRNLLDGNDNVVIGVDTGDNLTTGSRNIIIGDGLDFPDATGSNQLNIGNIIYGTNIDGVTSTVSTGNIGIGVADPAEKLEVNGKVRVSDLTGTDAPTDVIVTADAVTGELKEGGALSDIASGNEPWFGAGPDTILGTADDTGATLNTEDIYSLGNVGIGTPNPNEKLEVNGNAILDGASFSASMGGSALSIGKTVDTHQNNETAVGINAALNNSGDGTSAFGNNAASGNSGSRVTAMGLNAALNNTGSSTTAIGWSAASGNTVANTTVVGSGSGANNAGQDLTLVGANSGSNNLGISATIVGSNTANNNTGGFLTTVGFQSAASNTGSNVSALGYRAARFNTGSSVVALGSFAANNNTSNDVVAVGHQAAVQNTGNTVIAIGTSAAVNNRASDVVAIGASAANGNGLPGQTIFSNNSLPSYADRATALAAITMANGAVTGNTYLYYNAATFTIEAVRL